MAIITTLVGLGVLLVFTVLGCVLEVFLARRESIWPGLALPILAGLYAVVMALSYTSAPERRPPLCRYFSVSTTAYRRRWVRAVSRSATMSMAEKPSATR